jgi:hypothetical protein
VKAYQVRNQAIFAARWATELGRHPAVGEVPSPALLLRGRRQVLILDEEVPQPDRDSGSLRQVNLIRLLLQGGAHVAVPTRREHAGGHRSAAAMGVEVRYAPPRRVAGRLRSHGSRFDVACWCVTTSPTNACRCSSAMRRRHGPCSTPSTCTTCANAAVPKWPATQPCCVQRNVPAAANWP